MLNEISNFLFYEVQIEEFSFAPISDENTYLTPFSCSLSESKQNSPLNSVKKAWNEHILYPFQNILGKVKFLFLQRFF